MPRPRRRSSARERRQWQQSAESGALYAAAQQMHSEARARVDAFRAGLGEGQTLMPDGKGNYQVGTFGAAKQAQWVLVECQWQGGSKQACSQPIHAVAVRAASPVEFEVSVHVCDTHYPAYIAAARRSNILA